MLEQVGNKDIIVRNYTNNFDIKEFIQEVLIPKAFPDFPCIYVYWCYFCYLCYLYIKSIDF